MTREIRDPSTIPTAQHHNYGDHEEVELICRECDINFHAEGNGLHTLRGIVAEWHYKKHQGVTW